MNGVSIRLALAQTDPTVGDLVANAADIVARIEVAVDIGADVIVFPELAISGYPPEDLLIRPHFIKQCKEALLQIAEATTGVTAIVGVPLVGDDGTLKNVAAILHDGKWVGTVEKTELPNYGVFDERRYFTPGKSGPIIQIGDANIGVTVCEDIWVNNTLIDDLAARGANLFINISASPFRTGVLDERIEIVSRLASKTGTHFVYVNLVGGQDELVFDGGSFICDGNGDITDQALRFTTDLHVTDVPYDRMQKVTEGATLVLRETREHGPATSTPKKRKADNETEIVYRALTLGVRDYARKNGFHGVVIALSGGIDSALTAVIAADALGPEKVHLVTMPSPYSSKGSVDDSVALANNIGAPLSSLAIEQIMDAFTDTLAIPFANTAPGVAEENIQARIRGALVMALSNKFGWLTLTTGNKSEMAVGYATLYGDMAGGFAVIKDVFKTKVYELCRWRNKSAGYDLIPAAIIDKPPSAELRPDQKDSDSLPEYDILDPVLAAYIERDMTVDEIVELGYSRQLVLRVTAMVDRSEYKRRQGPIGVKITAKAFGRDRRLPITNRFKNV
jgi:NAD+ synthase (glutamine-hydrolysing)